LELSGIGPVGRPSEDPRSDWGVRIFYGFSGAPTPRYAYRLSGPPETGNLLPYSEFTRRKRHHFDFDGESGNTIYIAPRYENEKGDAGPFGPIVHAVIP
jgi:hypothetical protein